MPAAGTLKGMRRIWTQGDALLLRAPPPSLTLCCICTTTRSSWTRAPFKSSTNSSTSSSWSGVRPISSAALTRGKLPADVRTFLFERLLHWQTANQACPIPLAARWDPGSTPTEATPAMILGPELELQAQLAPLLFHVSDLRRWPVGTQGMKPARRAGRGLEDDRQSSHDSTSRNPA